MTETFEINNLVIQDYMIAIKYYYITKIAQQKYRQTEKGRQKSNESNRRYYEKKKQDPEFMENQRIKAREKYQKKKDGLIDISFPNL